MDFSIDAKTTEILNEARAIMASDILPLEPSLLDNGYFATSPALDVVRDKVRAKGLFAPQLEKSAGGGGLDLMTYALLSKELGQSPLGHYCYGAQAPDAGNMEVLASHGTPAQQERFLAPMVAGKMRSCFGMTEPMHAGSNPTVMSTVAVKDGDGYRITGRKWFTTAADGAGLCIVMAVTDPDAQKHRRATMFLVPTESEGFKNERNIAMFGSGGEGFFSHSEISLDNVYVSEEMRLGAEGDGFVIAQERLGPGRIHHAMRWLGIAERALDMMVDRAQSRDMGTGMLSEKQMVQMWIAESRAEMDAAELMVLRAAWRIENEGFKAARRDISALKFFVAGVMLKVVDRAVQTHGALGLTDDTILGFFYAHERAARIYDGPDEVHKVVVARDLLRKAAAR